MELRRRTELRERTEAHTKLVDLPLADFIAEVYPGYERPDHLHPITDFFDRVNRGEVVRRLVSAPPQFGKSKAMAAGCAQYLARTPERPIIYASYGADLAEQKSRDARDIAIACGVELREDAQAVNTWLTPQGGGLRARGVGGSTIGHPAKLLVIDDPHKDRADAESTLLSHKTFDWYVSVAENRTHPDSSILVCHARWSKPDLIGRLKELRHPRTKKPIFEHFNLPAILPDGRPLWHQRSLDWLELKQQEEYAHDWQSQWLGEPVNRGERVFKGIAYYDKLPLRYRVAKGIDLAYTEKTSACHSASVVMLEDSDRPPNDPRYYVVDVRRMQCEIREFAAELEKIPWPGTFHFYGSVQEVGLAPLIANLGVQVNAERAAIDKLARAQAVAAAWNQGRIYVPRSAPWLQDFIDELGNFTGVKGRDRTNDQVDAFVSAFEGVRFRGDKPKTVTGSGSRYGDARGFG